MSDRDREQSSKLDLVSLLDALRDGDVVDQTDIARVTGTTPRSVNRWAEGASPRRPAEKRLLELKAVVDLLRTALDDEPARLWLRRPIPDLGYEKPLELIEQGEYRRVVGAIQAMAEGVTA